MPRSIPRSLVLLLLAAPAFSSTSTAPSTNLAQSLGTYQAAHGPAWSVRTAPGSSDVELVHGGTALPRGAAPRFDAADEEWTLHAHALLVDAAALLGVDVGTLTPTRTLHLPLGTIGSGDKWTVAFQQTLGGVPVERGTVNLLLDARGRLLSIENHALADAGGVELEPLVTPDSALALARLAFGKHAGVPAELASTPELVVLQRAPADSTERRTGVLAWRVDVRGAANGDVPQGITYWIDARRSFVLEREASVHTFDISGTVSTFATPGTRADSATNPETLQGAKYIRLQNGTFNVTADTNGNFTIPGVNTAQSVTLTYDSPYAHVTDSGGATYSFAATLNPGSGNLITLNASSIDAVTAQANCLQAVATVRDYVRRINPSDATADGLYNAIANIASSCNAYYDGNINFYAQSTTCANTAFSTVIAHEEGHGLNVRYSTGNGGDGMGEGNADVWALYTYDTPINGDDFFLSGGDVRNGNNTRPFCGDCNPGCYGEVHADGEPWMGAAWKTRVALDNALGNTAGDLVADQLFLAWMNAYNQTQIQSVIELQWLLLDDDDANLVNGTPHSAQIRSGFGAQGFPGYFLEVSGLTAVADQTCEQGSYPIGVVASTVQGTTITSVALQYSIGGGPTLSVPMTNTSGSNWTGSIPYVPSPATVSYNVVVTDNAGHTKAARCSPRSFLIAGVNAFVTANFEDATDAGWTHASVGDTSNTNDDWQRGTPAGRTGTSLGVNWTDPAAAVSGTRAWGNDLGGTGFNGAYQSNVHSYLQSPALNCSGHTNVQLIFKRWLTVEESLYDTARILVNGVEVWRNPQSGNTLDTQWSTQVLDIAALADDNPSVTLRFELQSDGGLELGGWQIDDVQLGQIVAAPACAALTSFCAGDGSLATPCPCGNTGGTGRGCANSVNATGALLAGTGAPNPETLVLTASGMPNVASNSAIFLQGDAIAAAGIVFGDGLRCIDGTLVRLGTKPFPAGSASYPQSGDAALSVRGGVTPGSGVSRGYQVYYRNSASGFCPPATFNVTNAVRVIW